MNILYVTHTKDGSGARIALANMVKGMVAKGHTAYAVTPTLDCIAANSLREAGANIIVAPVCSTCYPRTKNPLKWVALLVIRFWKWKKSKRLIRKAILEHHIDIVHTNVGPLNIAPPVCRKLCIPHVWHIREFQEKIDVKFFPRSSVFKKEILGNDNHNIGITRSIYEHYSMRANIDKVIYDGVFPTSVVEEEVKPFCKRNKTVMFVGRVEEAKGTLELINAFMKFHCTHSDWRLQIVGHYRDNSYYFQECRKACLELVKQQHALFLGKRPDVYDLMRDARIVVVPSFYEGFGFVTAEAMANGCLVIGRNTSGTKEQMDNGKNLTGEEIALRFETQEELVEQLYNAADNDYSEMIERGRRTAVELYSLEKTSSQVEQYYKWIIRKFNENKS